MPGSWKYHMLCTWKHENSYASVWTKGKLIAGGSHQIRLQLWWEISNRRFGRDFIWTKYLNLKCRLPIYVHRWCLARLLLPEGPLFFVMCVGISFHNRRLRNFARETYQYGINKYDLNLKFTPEKGLSQKSCKWAFRRSICVFEMPLFFCIFYVTMQLICLLLKIIGMKGYCYIENTLYPFMKCTAPIPDTT